MNINFLSIKQNFGLKLYDKNGREINNFGAPYTFDNSPATRGNRDTVINVKNMKIMRTNTNSIANVSFSISNPIFEEQVLNKDVSLPYRFSYA